MFRRLRHYIPNSQENGLVALLAFVGAVVNLKDVLGIVLSDSIARWTMVLVFLSILAGNYARVKRIRQLDPLPTRFGAFMPFQPARAEQRPVLWKRGDETNELCGLLLSSEQSHLILAGPSGAGKSKLVSELLQVKFHDPFVTFRAYDQFFLDLLQKFPGTGELNRKEELAFQIYKNVKQTPIPVHQVLSRHFESAAADRCWLALEDFLACAISQADSPVVFVFDQVERLISLATATNASGEAEVDGLDVWLFLRLISFLRTDLRVRTIFIIRAEYLYHSFEFLEKLAAADSNSDSGTVVVHMLCPGINTETSRDAVDGLRATFLQVRNNAEDYRKFQNMNGLGSRAFANTFMAQLSGYMIEHFFGKDERVAQYLNTQASRDYWLHLYFEYVLNDFDREDNTVDSLDMLRATLYAIAVENRIAGQAVTVDRLAGLAHIPTDEAQRAIAFLHRKLGIVEEEEQHNSQAYRIVHDILADYIIENEQFSIEPRLKDAIRGLSESRTATESLTRINRFANPFLDLNDTNGVTRGLSIALWAFFIFGALRIASVSFCDFAYEKLTWWMPFSMTCMATRDYYVPTYFLHVVWVTYIYLVDRNYLQYVLRGQFARNISAAMPVMGAALGILCSSSPVLYLLPVCAIGLIFGSIMVLTAWSGQFAGRVKRENLLWGGRTFFNMAFTVVLMPLTALLLWNSATSIGYWSSLIDVVSKWISAAAYVTPTELRVGWFVFQGLLMVYFWWHIRPEQQIRISFAAHLALFDRTRLEEQHISNATAG